MGNSYNIHDPTDDLYYHCPDNTCPCQGTVNPFHGCPYNSCSCHYDGTPDDPTCGCPCHEVAATNDDYQHYDHIFSPHNYD